MCFCLLYCLPPLHHFYKLPSHEETTANSLSHCDQGCQFLISHLLKSTQQTSLEEHLDHETGYYTMKSPVCCSVGFLQHLHKLAHKIYLGVSKSVLVMINVNGSQKLLAGFFVVNKLAFWDDTGIQHLVSVKK